MTRAILAALAVVAALAWAGRSDAAPVQPGQSWDAACEAAAPGAVIELAGGTDRKSVV